MAVYPLGFAEGPITTSNVASCRAMILSEGKASHCWHISSTPLHSSSGARPRNIGSSITKSKNRNVASFFCVVGPSYRVWSMKHTCCSGVMFECCLSEWTNAPDNILVLIGWINRTVTSTTVSCQKSSMIAMYIFLVIIGLPGLKGLVKEMHCCPSRTKPDTSETSLVQIPPFVVSTVSGHTPAPLRHWNVDIRMIINSKFHWFKNPISFTVSNIMEMN